MTTGDVESREAEVSDVDWVDGVLAEYADRGLAGRLGPSSAPAVVVVDLIRGFTDPACPPGSDLDSVVAQTSRVLEAARSAGVPVYFTTIAFQPADLANLVWLRKMPVLDVLRTGSEWVDVDPRLERRSGEPVLVKQAASAFNGTPLGASLLADEVDGVLVCGATTSGCVRATVIDACALNLATYVPRECVGDRAAGPHEANLLDIDAKYADVLDVDEALRMLEKAA